MAKKIKHYAIQKYYRKNGVSMVQLKNLKTGALSYRREYDVTKWYYRPEFNIVKEATFDNVKRDIEKINRRIAMYRKDLKDTKDLNTLMSKISAVVGGNNVTNSGYISTNKKTIEKIMSLIASGGKRTSFENILNETPTPTQLARKNKMSLHHYAKTQQRKFIFDELVNQFFTWYYDEKKLHHVIENQYEILHDRLNFLNGKPVLPWQRNPNDYINELEIWKKDKVE